MRATDALTIEIALYSRLRKSLHIIPVGGLRGIEIYMGQTSKGASSAIIRHRTNRPPGRFAIQPSLQNSTSTISMLALPHVSLRGPISPSSQVSAPLLQPPLPVVILMQFGSTCSAGLQNQHVRQETPNMRKIRCQLSALLG